MRVFSWFDSSLVLILNHYEPTIFNTYHVSISFDSVPEEIQVRSEHHRILCGDGRHCESEAC